MILIFSYSILYTVFSITFIEELFMRILICDDDILFTEQLYKYLHEYFERQKLKCPEIVIYHSGDTLLKDNDEKDIIFLDIEMPGVDGIYTGKELKTHNPNVIIFIITSYAEYLDEAMRFHVFRYLSKPLDKQRLYRNIKDALQLYNRNNIKLAIETKQGIYTICSSDIICVEAQNRKVIIHTTSKSYESIHNIQFWLSKLQENCFFQSHRSFIVNFAYICDFDNTVIHLYNHQLTAYLTRRKYTSFKEAYLLYLENTR